MRFLSRVKALETTNLGYGLEPAHLGEVFKRFAA